MTRGRRRAILVARAVVAVGSVTAVGCGAAFALSLWFVVAGTLACAITAMASFYAAFEGFDERLRRRP
jgi:hypothetical protein